VLNALLSSGFRLQRVNRVRLLRAVEELGGKMDYRDLCQVLLNCCADWTAEEKQVVHKILKSMGVTVIERRNWLAKLRQSLMDASAKVARRNGRWFAAETGSAAASEGAEAGIAVGMGTGIPPSAFLHCMRDCGVVLTVEEEATLLDCLDTERLSKEGQAQLEGGGSRGRGKESWSIPMIEYETFLQYCGRHCGTWTDAAPEIGESVKWAMRSISSPVLAVHEFASLMHAFDETSAGYVSKRAFQICCHRSRLLANLPEESVQALADILTVDGGGKIDYTNFIVYLRATSSSLGGADSEAPGIIDQLVRNCTDERGTLLPLRNWLMRNTDMESFLLTPRDMNALLREFSVMYRPEDLEELQMDIGKHVDASRVAGSTTGSSAGVGGNGSMKKHVFDSRDLMLQVLQARPRWTTSHPYLCKRMLQAMRVAGSAAAGSPAELLHYDQQYDTSGAGTAAGAAGSSGSGSGRGGGGGNAPGGSRGIETAIARRIMSRLRAFSGRSAISLGAMDRETRARDGDSLMVERDIFKHLTGVTGLPLSDEDILILADATDFLPEASRVRADVILEALFGGSAGAGAGAGAEEGAGGGNAAATETEAGIFALEHLKDLLWKHAARLHRTTLEWVADVRTVFKGFDASRTGFISTEDFNIALNLLNASVAPDLLLDISSIPEGQGLVDYKQVLDYVLVPPNKSRPSAQTAPAPAAPMETARSAYSAEQKDTHATTKLTVKKKVVQKESPIQLLVNVVRKSLHHFIVSDHSLEQAWVCLLKVFQRFDPAETNQVAPRDFCLAVSVLLDGEDVVLTKSEWAEIIDHFAALGAEAEAVRRRQTDFLGGAMVDYMMFCETVLDPNEIKSRLYEQRANDKQASLDRTKQHSLSRSGSGHGHSAGGGRGGGSGSAHSEFRGHVVGSGVSGVHHVNKKELLQTHPAPSSSSSSSARKGSAAGHSATTRPRIESDSIAQRFDSASKQHQQQGRQLYDSRSTRASGGGSAGYNNAGARASTAAGSSPNIPLSRAEPKKSDWNTDELYRVARTTGQASRDSARGGRTSAVPLRSTSSGGIGGGMASTRQTFNASHQNRGNPNPASKFHWDPDA
jgi:Ca2+-binding EF-hand superfamily protein